MISLKKPKATVVVEIEDDFLGQTYTYDVANHKHPEVQLINHYAEVSVEMDGKPEKLGKTILSMFSNFNDIDDEYELLDRVYCNVIAEGDCKIFGEPSYDKWKNNWDDCKPMFYGSIPEMKEDYQYLFQNREWYVRSRVDDSILDFTKLSEIIPQDNSEEEQE